MSTPVPTNPRAGLPTSAGRVSQNQPHPTGQSTASIQAAKLAELQRRRVYDFAETSERILAKYADEPASLDLHIHHTHYRFGNQEGILPKNTSAIKTFFEYIASGEIPPAATEVFRDSGIRFYSGCIIVKLIDHRNVPIQVGQHGPVGGANEGESSTPNSTNTPGNTANATTPTGANGVVSANSANNTAANTTTTTTPTPTPEPTSYRVLLRPTPLSLWHDLLYTADTSHGRFSDQLALNMESEILTLTQRNIDLRVPEKPRPTQEEYLLFDNNNISKKRLKNPSITSAISSMEESRKLHRYRLTAPKKRRGLHEDIAHHGTEYEELMLIMDEKRQSTANPNGGGAGGQFMRLSFIEQLRKKRERIRLLGQQQRMQQQIQQPQGGAGVSGSNGSIAGASPVQQSQQPPGQSPFATPGTSNSANNKQVQMQMQLQQQQQQQMQLQPQQSQQPSISNNGTFMTGATTTPTPNNRPTAFSAGLTFDNQNNPSKQQYSTSSIAAAAATKTPAKTKAKQAGKTVPGKTVPGKTTPGTTINKGRPRIKKEPSKAKKTTPGSNVSTPN